MTRLPSEAHLHIGAILFPGIDQMDFTGPFEILSRLPNSTFHVIGRDKTAVRDVQGLILTPEKDFSEVPPLDVLIVPGGPGQLPMMEDEEVLAFVRRQAASAKIVFSVCTGALIVAAAGLLRGVRSTTHWSAFHVLELLGVVPVNQRVVADGKFVSAAGVSSGIDGALRVAALLRGEFVARKIQLYMQYAPEPPFDGGIPETAPAEVLAAARETARELSDQRLAMARKIAARWRQDS